MLLSVFTPTHDSRYLLDAYDSLLAQTYAKWEWVIVRSKDGVAIPEAISKDPRVRIFDYFAEKIGELKAYCCEVANGDAYVELDHDDLLVPGILGKIADKFEAGADFVYSDTAVFSSSDYSPQSYSAAYGWTTYPFQVYGRHFLASRAFPVTARSLCEIFYAPDHVRAWSRTAYEKTGGHAPDLKVGDDHDLLCRTYCAGLKFAHTGTAGYLYRLHNGNTVRRYNAEIQKQQALNRDSFIYRLINEWLRREKSGYMDLTKAEDQHRIRWLDGRASIDAPESSIGAIRAFDYLETIPQQSIVSLMNEFYRVLTPGGWLCVRTPSTDGRLGFAPYVQSRWNEHTFQYFTDMRYAEKLAGYTGKFQLVRCFTMAANPEEANRKLLWSFGDMCALKGQIQPGLVRW